MARNAAPRCETAALESGLGAPRPAGHLGHREARTRAMLEEIDEAFVALDWEYRFVHANEAALRMVGKPLEELSGATLWKLFPTMTESPLGEALRAAMELGRPSVIEYQTHLSGTWLEARIYPTPAGVSAYYREIKERKRIEQEARAARAELEATLAAITDGFYTLDRKWRVTYLNDKAAAVFPGGKAALHTSFWELFPEAAGSTFETNKRAAMEQGEFRSFESHYPPFDAWFEERDYPSAEGITVLFTDVSERKRADQALRDAEQKSQDLVRYAPTGIYEIDFRGPVFKTVNDAMCSLSGYERGELLAMNPFDLLDAESQAVFAERLRRGLAGESIPDSVEYRFRTKDGRLRDVVLNTTFTETDGVIDGALVVGYDVTERKQAEEAVRESEERFRLLHDTMLQGVVYQDADGTIISMNPAAERILGKRPQDFLGSSSVGEEHDTLREDGSPFPGLEHPAMVALRTGQQVPDVLMQVYNPRESRYRLISIQAVPLLRPGEDKPYRVYTVFDDITERKQAEDALRASEERFRLALRNAPVSVSAQDRDLRYVWAYNQRSARPEQIIGKLDTDIFTPEEAERLGAIKRRVLDEGVEIHEQMWLERPSGRMFLDVTFEPIRDEGDKVVGVGTATVDLTPMKLAEEALRESEQASSPCASISAPLSARSPRRSPRCLMPTRSSTPSFRGRAMPWAPSRRPCARSRRRAGCRATSGTSPTRSWGCRSHANRCPTPIPPWRPGRRSQSTTARPTSASTSNCSTRGACAR